MKYIAKILEKYVIIAYFKDMSKNLETYFAGNSRLSLKMCGYSLINARAVDYQYIHKHNFWQMNLCNHGQAELELDDYKLNVNSGDIIIIPPGNHHGLHYDEVNHFGCFSFKFDLNDFPALKLPPVIVFSDEKCSQRTEVIEAVSKIFHSFFPEELYRKQLEFAIPVDVEYVKIMEDLLFGILRRYMLMEYPSESPAVMLRQISEFVAQSNGKPVTTSQLATHFGYSSGHLLALVKKQTGKSTKQIIDEERIKTAKRFLHYSNMNVSEIAEYMEFTDVIYFCRFFKKYTGETPSAYTRRCRI